MSCQLSVAVSAGMGHSHQTLVQTPAIQTLIWPTALLPSPLSGVSCPYTAAYTVDVQNDVYQWIINDVIRKFRENYSSLGIRESVLQELQQTWELKVRQAKVADPLSSNEGEPYEDVERLATLANAAAVVTSQNSTADADARLHQAWEKRNAKKDRYGDDDDDDDDDEDGNDDDIGSDLDDDDDDEDDQNSGDIILCQYEKVSRIKNKWKCILKDGVINANGKDYLFNKANGDFEW
ncbi:transcription factor IIA, alpha/beta subunit-domain-containing protein [Polychytrium aggregatum]|uniref:transcription factor IIA, alpha/beta subunit-domain-containing protein n=1 Tax=Polychytrium aggregatum TaxID=110093 RepID=UPI0022FE12BD|nr:transcription factor IIA, alpha/beta subunit-domain-containing protein [Polychytrium aggregatum]KAI9208017.1 transcription factor IIA, alpha/beta subunit-domain-containing protein [Polychytrium aggregatum]